MIFHSVPPEIETSQNNPRSMPSDYNGYETIARLKKFQHLDCASWLNRSSASFVEINSSGSPTIFQISDPSQIKIIDFALARSLNVDGVTATGT
jgi:hypothetical protein